MTKADDILVPVEVVTVTVQRSVRYVATDDVNLPPPPPPTSTPS